tara:strand:- start:311 stop:1099 length:789 start_codon:yes stop_codon:yes gene_type:complete
MYTHNLDPIMIDFGLITIRWYSAAYIFGILLGWWYGKRIILKISNIDHKIYLKFFDDLITYIIISIIIGGRLGYIIFYNIEFYINNPMDVFKIWKGGMSFHGALIGIIFGTYLFSKKKGLNTFLFLDIIACVAPIGLFFGRIANFINGELVGKVTNVYWGVIFTNLDDNLRHPSQLYEAFLEGVVLFFVMNFILLNKNYKVGHCSSLFLIFYGIFRIFSEFFREPDVQLGYIYEILSMGMILSLFMITAGLIIYLKKNEKKS